MGSLPATFGARVRDFRAQDGAQSQELSLPEALASEHPLVQPKHSWALRGVGPMGGDERFQVKQGLPGSAVTGKEGSVAVGLAGPGAG